MVHKYAFPLTFLFVYSEEEPAGWLAQSCEISAASDGETLDEARQMIQDAVGLLVSYELEEGQVERLARPVSPEHLAEYYSGDDVVTEYYTLVATVETEPKPKVLSLEFLPSSVVPFCRHQPAAA